MAGGGRGGTSHLKSEVGAGMGSSRRESMNVLEVADVLRWREKTRASWSACASYCGRSEADVRKACEAVLKGATLTAGPKAGPVQPTREDKIIAECGFGPRTLTQLQMAVTCRSAELRALVDALIASGQLESRRGRGGGTLVALPGGFPSLRSEPVVPRGKRKAVREPVLAALGAGLHLAAAIADRTGLSKPAVTVCLSKLAEVGLVTHRRIKGSRAFHYSLTEKPE